MTSIVELLDLLVNVCAACKSLDDDNITSEDEDWDGLFKGEKPVTHPLLKAFQPVWPMLKQLQKTFSTQFEVADVLARLVKNVVYSASTSSVSVLPILCELNLNSIRVSFYPPLNFPFSSYFLN